MMLWGQLKKHNSFRFTEHGQSSFITVSVCPHKDIKQLYSYIFNMMGLLRSCSHNACAGINNNLSPSLEHDMQFTDVARNPAT